MPQLSHHGRRGPRKSHSAPAGLAPALVGRNAALAELRERLRADAPRIGLLTGPAGVGKTALVDALQAEDESIVVWDPSEPVRVADIVVVELDDSAERAQPSAAILAAARHIVLVARSPELARAVARRLSVTDPWHLAVDALELDAARQLAERLGVDAEAALEVAERACGYPLLVAIEAAQRSAPAQATSLPAPLQAWRASEADTAWLAAAIVRRLSETLLSAMLDPAATEDTAAGAFDALRARLPLCTQNGRLALPETLRALALGELHVRAPERRTLWARRAQDALLAHLEAAAHDEVPSLVADLLFACRFEPHAASLIDARVDLRLHFDASAATRARALAAIERFEGTASAQLLAAWWAQPEARIVETRTVDGRPVGFALNLAVHPDEVCPVNDPVMTAVCTAVRAQGARLAPAERVVIGRFWADYEHHQQVKPTIAQWSALVATEAVVSASVHRDAARWRAASERPFAELTSAEVDGVGYAVFGLDRRRESPAAPFARLVATCRGGGLSRVDDDVYATWTATRDEHAGAAHGAAILHAAALADRLRDALRNVHRADRLARSPLLDLQLMRPTAEDVGRPPAARLLARLAERVERLGSDGHDGILARTLRVTYFSAPRKGVAVAEALGMGHSTYRRWLRAAVARLAEELVTEERALRDAR